MKTERIDDTGFTSIDFNNRDDALAWYEYMSKFVPPSVENNIINTLMMTLLSMFVPGDVWRGSYRNSRVVDVNDHNVTYIKACQKMARETLKAVSGQATTPRIEEYLDILHGIVEFDRYNLENFFGYIQYALEEVEQRC